MASYCEKKTKITFVVFIVLAAFGYLGIFERNVNDIAAHLSDKGIPKNAALPDLHHTITEIYKLTECTRQQFNLVKFVSNTSAPYLIPDNYVLDEMDEEEVLLSYWRYINTHEVTCKSQTRLGARGDGGKEICLDGIYQIKEPCLVYSFGSNFEFDFEEDTYRRFKCEIHTFDPSHRIGDHKIPSTLKFHLIGLDGVNATDKHGWKMLTLSAIREMLQHTNRQIDILKIDIEGGEWHSFPDMFTSGVLRYVKQVAIELHFGRSKLENWQRFWGDVTIKEQLKIIGQFRAEGFRLFSHEYVNFSLIRLKQPYGCITNQNEISLINTNLI